MKPIIPVNNIIRLFLLNCLKSDTKKEFKEKIKTVKTKTGKNICYENNNYDVYYCSLKNGNVYLSFFETEKEIVILGYHLNNNDIDENGNFIFIDGTDSKQQGKVNILINKGVKI